MRVFSLLILAIESVRSLECNFGIEGSLYKCYSQIQESDQLVSGICEPQNAHFKHKFCVKTYSKNGDALYGCAGSNQTLTEIVQADYRMEGDGLCTRNRGRQSKVTLFFFGKAEFPWDWLCFCFMDRCNGKSFGSERTEMGVQPLEELRKGAGVDYLKIWLILALVLISIALIAYCAYNKFYKHHPHTAVAPPV